MRKTTMYQRNREFFLGYKQTLLSLDASHNVTVVMNVAIIHFIQSGLSEKTNYVVKLYVFMFCVSPSVRQSR